MGWGWVEMDGLLLGGKVYENVRIFCGELGCLALKGCGGLLLLLLLAS